MHTTKASLLLRLRDPAQKEAWTRFVDLYTPLLYYWLRQRGVQEQDAADLVQEVFVLLLQKLPQFAYDAKGSFRTWLRTVTLNKWREKQRRLRPDNIAPDQLADCAGADDEEPFWEAEYRDQLIRRALELMQADFQPTTWQACWEVVAKARPAAEVAGELGLSVGAVHAARFRVLARLREELAGLID